MTPAIRLPSLPAWLQRAKLWASRWQIMGVDCRCVPIGFVTPNDVRREYDFWMLTLCGFGIAPGLIHFIATM